ncbi:protein FAR1-RELATED SEQUENCE 5-like [Helianthus annuus]|uniref:protein FAR1-RELATED SEQUENCE 5-like n=1 Tax=Helianthus annuus TaxID=4232 RepID=UPI000B909354|nr:protein FAR1-RELATED SEQUENCE 5-like [Helianthus annuus]
MASSSSSTNNGATIVDALISSNGDDGHERIDESTDANNSSYGSHNVRPLRLYDVDQLGDITSHVYITTDGTKFWKPLVSPEYTPTFGMVFDTWSDAENMYKSYAERSGFSVRLGALKRNGNVITHRYMQCTRSSKPKQTQLESMDPSAFKVSRSSSYKVTDCRARLKLKAISGTTKFFVYGFIEAHNHGLVDKDNLDFTRKRMKLSYDDQRFIHKLSLNKIGPNVAHKIRASLKGGHHNVQGTLVEFKNFTRDLRSFIGKKDAQMVVDTLKARMINLPNFFFECVVVDGELRSLFWADDVSKCNYEAFGDVLGFDATYHTNQYNMIFVPFTGVDHHKKCVTFGAGLLYDETIGSYTWLLTTFLKAHNNKQPMLVLTDQDAAMKQAVSGVFNKSIHRLCMWHIVRKIPAKIAGDVLENIDLRAAIHKLVWNLFITPEEFEERWNLLMEGLHLKENNRLNEMYEIRDQWVPCYFRDVHMCCLMKTTSRCESSNSLFKTNSSGTNTLVQFLMCFDTAIDGQRYTQRRLEFESNTIAPSMPKNVPIERHASELYTHTLFLEVQKEIYRGMHSAILLQKPQNLMGHAFCVYRYNQVDEIPVQYQPGRWKRDILPRRVFSMSNRYSADTDTESVIRNEIFDLVIECTDRLRHNIGKLSELSGEIKEIRNRVFREFPTEPTCNKTSAVISDLLKQPEDMEVSINPPQGIRNKGCGTNHRLIGPGEKAVVNSAKTTRLCGKCKKYINDHDSRNCEKVRAAKEAAAAAAKAVKVGNVAVPEDSCHVGVVDLSNGDTSVGPSSRICTRATRRSTRRSTVHSSDPLEE